MLCVLHFEFSKFNFVVIGSEKVSNFKIFDSSALVISPKASAIAQTRVSDHHNYQTCCEDFPDFSNTLPCLKYTSRFHVCGYIHQLIANQIC